MKVTSATGLVRKFRLRQAIQERSRYALSQELAKVLKVTPQSVDRKLMRMYEGGTLDVDFAIAVAKVLGLELTIGDV